MLRRHGSCERLVVSKNPAVAWTARPTIATAYLGPRNNFLDYSSVAKSTNQFSSQIVADCGMQGLAP